MVIFSLTFWIYKLKKHTHIRIRNFVLYLSGETAHGTLTLFCFAKTEYERTTCFSRVHVIEVIERRNWGLV